VSQPEKSLYQRWFDKNAEISKRPRKALTLVIACLLLPDYSIAYDTEYGAIVGSPLCRQQL